MKSLLISVFLLSFFTVSWAQVKIGDNPQTIDASSILELESSTKALVISRVSESQMLSMTPLQGAIVYNIDEECVFYFNGDEWINLCIDESSVNVSLEVVDDELVLTDSSGNSVNIALQEINTNTFTADAIFNPREPIIRDSTIIITRDGTNYNFEVGKITGFNIVDSSINGFNDIQDRTIPGTKLFESVAGEGLSQGLNGSLNLDLSEVTGTGTLSSNGTLEIDGQPNNSLFNDVVLDVADNSISNQKLEDNAVNTENITDGQVQTDDIANANITNVKLDKANIPLSGFQAAITNVDLGGNKLINLLDPTDAQDGATKEYVDNTVNDINTLGSGSIYIGDVTNTAQEVVITGDAVIDNVGTLTIERDAVGTIEIINNSIENEDLNKGGIPLSGFGAAAGDVPMGTNKLIDLADPDNPQDAATKNYVDMEISDLIASGGGTDDQDLTNTVIVPNESVEIQITDGNNTTIDIRDADSDATNELTNLELNTNILTLSNPLTLGNQIDLSPYLDDTTLSEADVDAFVANNGFLAIETDGSTTNELADLQLNTNILTLSNPLTPGNQIDLSPYLDDTTLNEADVDAFVANNGFLTAEIDGSTTNELVNLELNTNILALSNPLTPGNQIDLTPYLDNQNASEVDLASAFDVDGDTVNETNVEDALVDLATENFAERNLTLNSDRTHNLNDNNLVFDGTGNVGIGDNNPDSKLQVSGEIRSTSYASAQGTAGEPAYSFYTGDDTNTGMYRPAADEIGFSVGGIDAMRIEEDANATKVTVFEDFHVVGNLFTTSGVVDGTIPDYVFQNYFDGRSVLKKDYEFKSLDEIEAFVKKNKHLPGVTSASKAQKDGYWNLSQSNLQNLEKIEELFLHTIEQEKKIQSLKKENEDLAKEVASLKKDMELIRVFLLKKETGNND